MDTLYNIKVRGRRRATIVAFRNPFFLLLLFFLSKQRDQIGPEGIFSAGFPPQNPFFSPLCTAPLRGDWSNITAASFWKGFSFSHPKVQNVLCLQWPLKILDWLAEMLQHLWVFVVGPHDRRWPMTDGHLAWEHAWPVGCPRQTTNDFVGYNNSAKNMDRSLADLLRNIILLLLRWRKKKTVLVSAQYLPPPSTMRGGISKYHQHTEIPRAELKAAITAVLCWFSKSVNQDLWFIRNEFIH